MHTVMVIAIGIALLAICVGAGRLFGVGLARGALPASPACPLYLDYAIIGHAGKSIPNMV